MKHVAWVACVAGLGVVSGCVSLTKYNALRDQNAVQAAQIKALDRDLYQAMLEADALRAQLTALKAARDASGGLAGAKDREIALLEARCADLEARIHDQLEKVAGRVPPDEVSRRPPPEVEDALKKLAASERTFEYDPRTGVCKFSSDVLFDSGDDTVRPQAAATLKKFAAIFQSAAGRSLYLRIDGHTDDRRVVKETTKAKHPTNWHLSVHRSISVLNTLSADGIEETRMSAAGYGKWRPAAPNATDAGRAQNRRVEIYVVNPPGPRTDRLASEPAAMGGE
jgi:chemotaxis protein MotB